MYTTAPLSQYNIATSAGMDENLNLTRKIQTLMFRTVCVVYGKTQIQITQDVFIWIITCKSWFDEKGK